LPDARIGMIRSLWCEVEDRAFAIAPAFSQILSAKIPKQNVSSGRIEDCERCSEAEGYR